MTILCNFATVFMKLERLTNSYNGRIGGKVDEASIDGEIVSIKEFI